MKLSVVLPCYNEEKNIARIPSELMFVLNNLGMDYEILIIDDGSTDNTYEVAKNLNIAELRIIKHEKNYGLGEAIKTAFRNLDSDITITLDADFTFHPKLIPDLIKAFKENDVDLVIGSPKLAGYCNDIPSYRLFISTFANIVYRILFKKNITAASQIFRLYKTDDIKNLKIEALGFDVFAEILFKLLVLENKKSIEIPAPLTEREYGVSKLNYKKEMVRHLKLLFKILWWRIANLGK